MPISSAYFATGPQVRDGTIRVLGRVLGVFLLVEPLQATPQQAQEDRSRHCRFRSKHLQHFLGHCRRLPHQRNHILQDRSRSSTSCGSDSVKDNIPVSKWLGLRVHAFNDIPLFGEPRKAQRHTSDKSKRP